MAFSGVRTSFFTLSRNISCMIILMLFFPDYPVNAQEARLTDIIVTNSPQDLLVYLKVEGAFTDEMKEAVLSRLPTTFSFYVSLKGVRNYWFDKEIADIKITHTIKYYNLKKEFIVNRSWEEIPQVVQSFDEARKLMTQVERLKIIPLSDLEKGKPYQMMAKAELSKLTLPLYLHYILFFVSFWDFETDWYSIDFIY